MSYTPVFYVDPDQRVCQLRLSEYDELGEEEQQQLRNEQSCRSGGDSRTLRFPASRPAVAVLAAAAILVFAGSALVAARAAVPRAGPKQESSSWRRPQRFFAQKDATAEDEPDAGLKKGEQEDEQKSTHEKGEQEDEQNSTPEKGEQEDEQNSAHEKGEREVEQKRENSSADAEEEEEEEEESNKASEKKGETKRETEEDEASSLQEEDGEEVDEEEKESSSQEEDGEDTREPSTNSSDGSCAKLWDQCGGKGFDGPTCCEEGLACKEKPLKKLPSYRQCRKEDDEDDSAEASAEESGEDCTGEAAGMWDQCGGEGYSGPTCCESGTTCRANPSDGYPSFRQCLAADKEEDAAEDESDANCSKLWNQCGGEGWDGPTCCRGKSECTDHPLKKLPSYRQCRLPPPPACEDAQEGSTCYSKVMWDINTGVWRHPDWFKNLTSQSDFKDFQEYEFMLNRNNSKCNKPCGPGSCFFTFRYEGCDSWNEWTCAKPDDSLGFQCCCEKYHNETNMSKPENPSPAIANAMEAYGSDSPTLFCTAMCMPDSYEVGLLRAQYKQGKLGLFGCSEWTVYSNKTIRLNPEDEEEALETGVIDGTLSGVMGGEFHTVLNTAVFLKFWNKVIGNKAALEAEWVVKVDPDTVFIPLRLRALLRTKEGPLAEAEPEHGLFLNNCHVGMHGPIEVLSKNALKTYKAGHKKCEEGTPAEHGQEDWFLRDCFHELGVLKVNAYNVLLEGTLACQERPSDWHPYRPPCFSPQVAFHPFKTIESYMHCMKETANHPWQLPVDPIGEGPRSINERHG